MKVSGQGQGLGWKKAKIPIPNNAKLQLAIIPVQKEIKPRSLCAA